MANDVMTVMEVSGDGSDIEEFVGMVDGGEGRRLAFNNIVSMPSELDGSVSPVRVVCQGEIDVNRDLYIKEMRYKGVSEEKLSKLGVYMFGISPETNQRLLEEYGANSWYDWCVLNWGTKWSAYNTGEWEMGDGIAKIWYATAWSPATRFLEQASEKFPNLTFKHIFADECGGFVGYEIIKNGDVIESESVEWDSDEGIALRKLVGMVNEDEIDEE